MNNKKIEIHENSKPGLIEYILYNKIETPENVLKFYINLIKEKLSKNENYKPDMNIITIFGLILRRNIPITYINELEFIIFLNNNKNRLKLLYILFYYKYKNNFKTFTDKVLYENSNLYAILLDNINLLNPDKIDNNIYKLAIHAYSKKCIKQLKIDITIIKELYFESLYYDLLIEYADNNTSNTLLYILKSLDMNKDVNIVLKNYIFHIIIKLLRDYNIDLELLYCIYPDKFSKILADLLRRNYTSNCNNEKLYSFVFMDFLYHNYDEMKIEQFDIKLLEFLTELETINFGDFIVKYRTNNKHKILGRYNIPFNISIANEKNMYGNSIYDYDEKKIVTYRNKNKIYVFTIDEFYHLFGSKKNPYTNEIIPNYILHEMSDILKKYNNKITFGSDIMSEISNMLLSRNNSIIIQLKKLQNESFIHCLYILTNRYESSINKQYKDLLVNSLKDTFNISSEKIYNLSRDEILQISTLLNNEYKDIKLNEENFFYTLYEKSKTRRSNQLSLNIIHTFINIINNL